MARHDGGVTQSDNVPTPSGGTDITTEAFLSRAPETRLLNLRVVEIDDMGTATRLIRLGGDDLADFDYAVGQDLMFIVDAPEGRIIRRRYTIRRFDRANRLLDLHIVTDSDGPGARWTKALNVGDEVGAIGPRGKITLVPDAATHLFVGDDVSAPAISAMVEALPAGSRAIVVIEVADAADETKIDPVHSIDLDWTWLHRNGREPGVPEAILATVASLVLPAEPLHAYVFGEASVVSAVSAALTERGVDSISPKAYWGRGRANASHGEPLKQ
jgi:NADPH-dependent ferric siderophore reductase